MGKQAHMSTQKVIMEQEALHMKVNSQGGRKPGQGEGKPTETTKMATESSRKMNALKENMQDWYNQNGYMLTITGKYSITKSYQALMGPKPRWNIAELI